jgi:hypothetical protein
VLGGDPRSTVGGGTSPTVLDAADGTEIISALAAMGGQIHTKASAAIAERLRGLALSLRSAIARGPRCARSEDAGNMMLRWVRSNFRGGGSPVREPLPPPKVYAPPRVGH